MFCQCYENIPRVRLLCNPKCSDKGVPIGRPSPPWVARILSGDQVPIEGGFDSNNLHTLSCVEQNSSEKVSTDASASSALRSGERWI